MLKGSHYADRTKMTYTDTSVPPKEGDTCKGTLVGKNRQTYIWKRCEACGNGRWVIKLGSSGNYNRYCFPCSTTRRTYSLEFIESHRQTCIIRNTTQPNPMKGKKLPPRNAEHSANISKALLGVPRPERRTIRGVGCLGTIEAPVIGDIRYRDELNENIIGINQSFRFIYVQCPICKKTRWSDFKTHRDSAKLGTNDKCKGCCKKENSGAWRGGTRITHGYRGIRIYEGDTYFPMANNRAKDGSAYILEHRLVMAKHLGRLLENWEVVHHRNHIKSDNRIENLELMQVTVHMGLTQLEEHLHVLENKVKKLEQGERESTLLIRFLLWRLKEFAIEKVEGGDAL